VSKKFLVKDFFSRVKSQNKKCKNKKEKRKKKKEKN
jgi:hypothetical protein